MTVINAQNVTTTNRQANNLFWGDKALKTSAPCMSANPLNSTLIFFDLPYLPSDY